MSKKKKSKPEAKPRKGPRETVEQLTEFLEIYDEDGETLLYKDGKMVNQPKNRSLFADEDN